MKTNDRELVTNINMRNGDTIAPTEELIIEYI
jgi:hypothetical protein